MQPFDGSSQPLSPRLQYILGSSEDIYTKWAKRNKIEDIRRRYRSKREVAPGFWRTMGGKIPDRVILYLHGGGFYLPMFEDSASFWYYVQKQLKESYQLDVGIAMLDYSSVILHSFIITNVE